VIAGLDLSKLQPSDVVVSGRSVSIHLPQAEIFTTRLDNAKTIRLPPWVITPKRY